MAALLKRQEGFSLLEVVTAMAITAMLSTIVGSLLVSVLTHRRTLQEQTDQYEGLRVPAAMIIQDARFAVRASCSWEYLQLFTSGSAGDYIMYQFGIVDPNNLHRQVWIGGVEQDDRIAGWSLVPPDLSGATDGTMFNCGTNATYRFGNAHLVAPPPQNGTVNTDLDVTALIR